MEFLGEFVDLTSNGYLIVLKDAKMSKEYCTILIYSDVDALVE